MLIIVIPSVCEESFPIVLKLVGGELHRYPNSFGRRHPHRGADVENKQAQPELAKVAAAKSSEAAGRRRARIRRVAHGNRLVYELWRARKSGRKRKRSAGVAFYTAGIFVVSGLRRGASRLKRGSSEILSAVASVTVDTIKPPSTVAARAPATGTSKPVSTCPSGFNP
jgi:hypothetical protein